MKTYYRRGLFDLAAQIGKKSFDGAIAELDCLSEDFYKVSALIMQLLRDDLTIASDKASEKGKKSRIIKKPLKFQSERSKSFYYFLKKYK
jgi:hypothetical protein